MKTAECRSCKAPIIWAETVNGKPMSVDAVPNLLMGNIRLDEAADPRDPPVAVVVGKGESGSYTSHFATCPNAASHRKKS